MKLLFKSIGIGILISLTIFMGFAIFSAVMVFINNLGGMPYVYGFIFLIAVVMFGALHYYQNK